MLYFSSIFQCRSFLICCYGSRKKLSGSVRCPIRIVGGGSKGGKSRLLYWYFFMNCPENNFSYWTKKGLSSYWAKKECPHTGQKKECSHTGQKKGLSPYLAKKGMFPYWAKKECPHTWQKRNVPILGKKGMSP